jgi:hypothetical protein
MNHHRINPDALIEAKIHDALGIDPWMIDPEVAKHAARERMPGIRTGQSGLKSARDILAAMQRTRVHAIQSTAYVDEAPKRDRDLLRGKK